MEKIEEIIDDAVAAAKPIALTRDITGAFGIVDLKLADYIVATAEDLEREHKIFKRRWDGGHFTDHDHLLKTYAKSVLGLVRAPCQPCAA